MTSGRARLPREVLGRTRLAALGFALVIFGLCGTQMDHGLPLARVAAADLALVGMALVAVMAYQTGQAVRAEPALTGLFLLVGIQGLLAKPAAAAMAIGLISVHSLYGSNRQTVLRLVAICSAFAAITVSGLDSTGPNPANLVVPVPMMCGFTLLLRTLHSALRNQQQASSREALMARTARALLGQVDLQQVRAILNEATGDLCRMTPGLGVLLLANPGGAWQVPAAFGDAAATQGAALTSRAAAAVIGLLALPGDRLTLIPHSDLAELPGLPPGQTLVALPLGAGEGSGAAGTGERLLVCVGNGVPPEVYDVIETLAAQLRMAEATCASHAELFTLAHQDQLTSISNRAAFFAQLTRAVDGSRGRDADLSLLMIDLDDFKVVNDSLGHAAGDKVLVDIAERMVRTVGARGIAARFGGDEFAVLLEGIQDGADVDRLAELLRDELIAPILWEGGVLRVGASIGIVAGSPGLAAGDLMRCADVAMYSAKALGKNRVVRFSDTEHGSIASVRTLEAHLQEAIARGEIVPWYEPIVEVASGRCVGVRVIPRWQHPGFGPVLAETFLPLAERQGNVVAIGAHLLGAACQDVTSWARPEAVPPLRLALSLSEGQLTDPGLGGSVAQTLTRNGMPGRSLTLELDESSISGDRALLDGLRSLREGGVGLAIDNFGAGPISLSTLRSLAADQLKINSRLLSGEPDSEDVLTLVMGIGELLGLETVAGGIRTPDELNRAAQFGIDLAHGPLFSDPLPADELSRWLTEGQHQPWSGMNDGDGACRVVGQRDQVTGVTG